MPELKYPNSYSLIKNVCGQFFTKLLQSRSIKLTMKINFFMKWYSGDGNEWKWLFILILLAKREQKITTERYEIYDCTKSYWQSSNEIKSKVLTTRCVVTQHAINEEYWIIIKIDFWAIERRKHKTSTKLIAIICCEKVFMVHFAIYII